MKNKAVFMVKAKQFEIQEIPMPTVGDDEVGVQMKHVGICGSDAHLFELGGIPTRETKLPLILGHECAGVVYEVGKNVKHLAVGDTVALEPGLPCGKCEYCLSGRYNLCPDVQFMAVPPYDGAMRKYMSYPAYMAFKLPEGMSTLEGALIEPLAVGIHAVKQGEVSMGDSITVLGGGCIGLATLLAAKAWGASKAIVADLVESRLELALKIGADYVINPLKDDTIKKAMELTDGKGTNQVFETAGNKITYAQTSHLVGRGGTVVIVGNLFDEVPYSFRNLYIKEAQIKTVFRYRNIFPAAIESVASGRIDIKSIVTKVYPFDQSQQAYDDTIADKQNNIKTIIEID